MKKLVTLVLVLSLFIATAYSQSSKNKNLLDVKTFEQQTTTMPGAITLDVRTPKEFEKGHLRNAVNFNWNDSSFTAKVSKMDKSSPVFVYCLSGGRSAAAAKKLRDLGFGSVYEMKGGILKWQAAHLPLETDSKMAVLEGMTLQQFEEAIHSDKKVLVDFYAEWCGPCKKMEPYLTEIARERADAIKLVRINIDANPALAKALKIDGLPVLHLYRNKKLQWEHIGFITKNDLLNKL